MLLPLALLAALWDCRAVAGAGIDASAAAQNYLSEDFFPGLHLLDISSDKIVAYKGGQLPEMPKPFNGRLRPVFLDMPRTMEELRGVLETALEIPEREELQNPWVLFDRQGGEIKDMGALKNAEVAFVQEVGVWVWPAVRVGFKQEATNVGGGKALLTTLSLRPKIFEVLNFLTDNETQTVMDVGVQQGLHSSQGVMQSKDLAKGTAAAEFRTSTQAWLHKGLSPFIGVLDERVAALTRVPESHQEAAQLLRYEEGKYYHNHMDWAELELYPDQKHLWTSSHMGHQDRLATVFLYLNDVPDGGETNFPKHGQPICGPLEKGGPKWRTCPGAYDPPANKCVEGMKVKPQRGAVVMWYNYHSSGRGDTNALHAGCPVGKGLVKWSANKWVRLKPSGSMGRWVENHPALKRHGWKGVGATAQPPDPNKCNMFFENAAGEDVNIMWRGENGQGADLGSLDDGTTRSMDSFRGHKFLLQAGKRESNLITCKPPLTAVRLNTEFVLELQGKKEL